MLKVIFHNPDDTPDVVNTFWDAQGDDTRELT